MSSGNINCIGDNCCGCEACYSVCPKNAIYAERGRRGELLYKSNEECINCGRCLKVCAANNTKLHDEVDIFYRAITKQKDVLKKSSSGGIAYEIARLILSEGGITYAAVWDVDKQRVQHSRIASVQELPAIQGSKYVHSTIEKDTYENILKDVKEHKVLFIGCPCQVSAVKNLVGDKSKLICIDLVCHGVPSAEMLKKQIKKITDDMVETISFRRGLSFFLDLKDRSGKTYSINGYDNPYYVLFLTYTSLRESCYKCRYAQRKRVGDLTIGDYTEQGKGYSCVLPNSEVGQRLVAETCSSIQYEERNTTLLKENDALNHPTVRSSKVDVFTERYNKRGIYYAYYRTFLAFVMKRIGRRLLGDKIYDKVIKRFKRK